MGFLTLGRRFLNNTARHHRRPHRRGHPRADGPDGRRCARCHDHKYDPIPTTDYYSLYGVFASSHEPKELPLIGEVKRTPEVDRVRGGAGEARGGVRRPRSRSGTRRTLTKLRDAESRRRVPPGRARRAAGSRPTQLQGFARERDLNRFVVRPLADVPRRPSGRRSRRCSRRWPRSPRSRRRSSRRRPPACSTRSAKDDEAVTRSRRRSPTRSRRRSKAATARARDGDRRGAAAKDAGRSWPRCSAAGRAARHPGRPTPTRCSTAPTATQLARAPQEDRRVQGDAARPPRRGRMC